MELGFLSADIIIYLLASVIDESNSLDPAEVWSFRRQTVDVLMAANFVLLGMI